MGTWVLLTAFYGLAKGARDGLKKKALEKGGVMEVLFFYTALAFLFTLPFSKNVFGIPPIYYLWIFIKSFVIFLAWILAFMSIKKMPISLYGVMDTARMLFSTSIALIFLGETMTFNKGIGFTLVLLGLIIVNLGHQNSDENVKFKYIAFSLLTCLFNAISGVMDKALMQTGEITASQLQFWYMLYMTLLYGIYILAARVPLKLGTLKTNYWIVVLSILFVAADRALFIANADPESEVTVMTLIKQSSVVITVLSGKLFFKEKHILKRAICAGIVIAGIVVATLK